MAECPAGHEISSWFLGTAEGEETLEVYPNGIALAGVAESVQVPRLEESLDCGEICWIPLV